MTPTMRFYGYFRSSAAWRCRIALNLKGLSPEVVLVHLLRGEQRADAYRALNPQGFVPALEADGLRLTQSLAIIEWLDERFPDPPLLPSDPDGRATVRAFAYVIACDIHPLQNLRVLKWFKENGVGKDLADAWLHRWLGDGLAACEALLSGRDGGPFCFGPAPTLADVCLIPQLASARRYGVPLDALPRLTAAEAAAEMHPAFAAAHASRQPDAEP